MPAFTTYLFQMIDVVVGKPFKDGMCDLWVEWMLNENKKKGVTGAGSHQAPTQMDCISWVSQT